MGSVGDAYDNALCESFFATLECELLDRWRFATQVEARLAVLTSSRAGTIRTVATPRWRTCRRSRTSSRAPAQAWGAPSRPLVQRPDIVISETPWRAAAGRPNHIPAGRGSSGVSRTSSGARSTRRCRPSTPCRGVGPTLPEWIRDLVVAWTAASPRRKRGRQSRPDQAREGPEVDGTGRWRGYSAGSIPGRGVPGGGDAAGPHAGEHAVERPACPADRRSGLRQKWPAPEAQRRGIQPIIPAHRNHPNATDQDGRCLRRYRRRWIVERTIGWLDNFLRLTVRYDRLMATYGGFFHLVCARRVVK